MWIAVTYELRKGKQSLGPFTTKMQHASVESALDQVRKVCAVRYPGAACTASGAECDPPAPRPKIEPPPPSAARAAKRAKEAAKIASIMAHKGVSEDDARKVFYARQRRGNRSLARYARKYGITQQEALTRLKAGKSNYVKRGLDLVVTLR